MLAWSGVVLTNGDLQRLPTAVRLSRKCCHTLQINVFIGPGWTILIVAGAALGWLGVAGALVAAILHNLSTLLVLLNTGRSFFWSSGAAAFSIRQNTPEWQKTCC
ncbi:hypothetical protein NIO16_004896 [Salmonella enterica]|nr:hypothetical protein [Salmonella enterica]